MLPPLEAANRQDHNQADRHHIGAVALPNFFDLFAPDLFVHFAKQ